MKGSRYNNGKLKWSYVYWPAIEPMVRVLMFGAQKYAPDNWKKGLPMTEIMESCLRHIFAFLQGEDRDPESGEHHLGHAMCNIMFALYMYMQRPDMDDRVIAREKQLELEFDESFRKLNPLDN